ncbi:MAG: PAS domain S-box protein [Methylophilaceae bacterium]|nr:PAS domain S-box protein [Methylophilaceae bacterium]
MLEKIVNCATPANNMAVNNPPDLTKNDTDLDFNILSATFNAIADAVIATDIDGHITRINVVAERLTGWKQVEAIGRPIDEIFYIIHAKTHQPVITPVLETLVQGMTTHLPKSSLLISKDCREYIIEDTCSPIINLNNQIIGSVIIFRDATYQESVQIALDKSKDLFSFMFNNVPIEIAHVAYDGRLLLINSEFSRIVGYSVAELLSYKYQKITHPDDLAESIAGYEQMLMGDIDSFSMEKRYIRKDGSLMWANLEIGCVRYANQEIDYFIAFVDDISARKQAILDSRRFFNLSQELLSTVGADGYFKSLNNAWEKALGYTVNELLAKPYMSFVHPYDHEMTLYEAQKLPTSHTTNSFENRYCCKNGSVRWLSWSAVAVVEDQLFYCYARDITERKQVEKDLKIRTEQFEHLINAAPFGNHLVDQDFRILQINPYALPVFGNTPDLIGRAIGEVMHMIWPTDKANEVNEIYRHTLETGESCVVEEMIVMV